jgi:Domain of unknown function (DUF222)
MFDTEIPSCDANVEASAEADESSCEAALSDKQLEDELCTQAAHLAVAEYHFVLLAAEFDRRELWGDGECKSCAHWLNWRCGISIATAREQVRVGRALERLPSIRSAFSCGELSYSKVRAITRIATPELEEELLVLARAATASQLERLAREYRRAEPDEGLKALERHSRRFLRSYTDHEGMVVISARLSPDDGAVVLAAIEMARQSLAADRDGLEDGARPGTDNEVSASEDPSEDVSAETSNETVSVADQDSRGAAFLTYDHAWGADIDGADALVTVCGAVLTRGLDDGAGEPKVSVLLHVDEDVLKDPAAEGCSYIEGVGAISSHSACRLACDGAVSELLYRRDGAVEPRGRTRTISKRTRRAVMTRDRGCRFPGCTQRRSVDLHHVVFWSRGGRSTQANLLCLCRFHHRRVHEGGYQLYLNATGALRVVDPTGTELPQSPPLPRHTGPCITQRASRQQNPIGAGTLSCGHNDPLDYDIAVSCLHAMNRRDESC